MASARNECLLYIMIALEFCVSFGGVWTMSRIDAYPGELHSRQKRFLLPTLDSCWGLTGAVVIPTDNKVRDVFIAYAIEANYNMPGQIADFFPPDPYQPIDSSNVNPNGNGRSHDNVSIKRKKKRSRRKPRARMDRSSFYNGVEKKLIAQGYDGHNCLLRAICEASESQLGMHNGVLGDILHIVLTPSSSKSENLSDDYYLAESTGIEQDCTIYHELCPISVLDLISV